jgi:hypothetical protein
MVNMQIHTTFFNVDYLMLYREPEKDDANSNGKPPDVPNGTNSYDNQAFDNISTSL